MSQRQYAYHCTNIDPEIIKREGWKVGSGFTLKNMFDDLYEKYLPKVPVFVSDDGKAVWDTNAKYIIKLDITGLDLYPDFGSLPDTGAYYDPDEECFYWQDGFSNPKMEEYVSKYEDEILYAEDFSGSDCMAVLGTACVDGSKLQGRMVGYTKKDDETMKLDESTKVTLTPKQLREAVSDLGDDATYDEISDELKSASLEGFCEQLSFLVKATDPKAQALYDTFKQGWKDEYEDVTVKKTFVSIRDLHPTQNVIFANKSLVPMLDGQWKVGGKSAVEVTMSGRGVQIPLDNPLVVCNVGNVAYIIDGHHRWSKFYAFNPTCQLEAWVIKSGSDRGIFRSADDVLKFAQGTLAALGQDTVSAQSKTDINMYTINLQWMQDMVEKNTTPEILQIAVESPIGRDNGIVDKPSLATYMWHNINTNMFEFAPAGVHGREYMPQYPEGVNPEQAVDMIKENTKFTLTIKQLRRLVRESASSEVLSFGDVEPGDLGKDYNDEEWLVLKKGTAEELIKSDDDPSGALYDGVMGEYIDPDEPCVLAKHMRTGERAAWVYGDDGVQVYTVADECEVAEADEDDELAQAKADLRRARKEYKAKQGRGISGVMLQRAEDHVAELKRRKK